MLERVSLLNTRRDFFLFSTLLLFILFYSLLISYNNYKILTHFDSATLSATVLKQYPKTKLDKRGRSKSYQVLKLKADDGSMFFTTQNKNFAPSIGKKLYLEIWAGKISFFAYMTSFYAYSKVLSVSETKTLKEQLNQAIANEHQDKNIAQVYQALYSANAMPRELQTLFSSLGVSHLIAISGFHLGVIASVVFFLIKLPYSFLQTRYFPYRNYKRDSFFILTFILLIYLLFLDSPPSLLRAFSMLVIGFILYDRGIKVLSMQTLFITLLLLLALFTKLLFAVGFWLSVAGVFYIFLFLIHFQHLSNLKQFILLPIWVYIFMLPYSLILFGNFSLYHPLSMLWTLLFTLFYPLSILLHILGIGDFLDFILKWFLELESHGVVLELSKLWLIPLVILSLGAIYKKWILTLLSVTLISVFIYLIYDVAQF